MNNVLVTGASGFVGSNIIKGILKGGHKYNVLVGTYLDSLNPIRLVLQGIDTGVTWVKVDISDLYSVERIINMYEIDTIFHMAAIPIVRISSRNPIPTFKSNIQGTWNLLEAARNCKTLEAMVVASSDKAYGSNEQMPFEEDFVLNAVHPYDASKACADILARTYAVNYRLPIVVTRACNMYGPGDFNFSRILPQSIIRLYNDLSPIIWKGVNQYKREFLHVEDYVGAVLQLVSNIDKCRGEAFNISTGDIWMVESIVNYLADIMGKPIRVSVVEKELDFLEVPFQYLSSKKIEKYIGWKSTIYFREYGVKNILDWYLNILNKRIKV